MKQKVQQLSESQKAAIHEAFEELKAGKGIPHKKVMAETKERFPAYF